MLAAGDEIALRDLPARVRGTRMMGASDPAAAATSTAPTAPSNESDAAPFEDEPQRDPMAESHEELPLNLEALERWAVERALRDKNGRLTEAAKALGIGRTTLYRKLEKYGLR